tara:strand:+ start:75 stop:311 length:237 start_codon:yes stop_codon:yes gene_type:complete
MNNEYLILRETKKTETLRQERMDAISSHIGALRAEVHSLSRTTKKVLLIEKILIVFFVLSLFSFASLWVFILLSKQIT